jgi:uncharacterized protein YacL
MSEGRHGRPAPRGTLVEFVRLIMVVLLAIAGFEIARHVSDRTGTAILGIVLGSASGYVLGGVLGRQTAAAVSSVEREFRRVSAAEIAAGVAGIVVALLIALLASIPLFHLPNDAAWPAVAFLYVTLTYLGFRIGRSKREELFSLIGLKPRAAGVGRAEVNVLDTSALIDGRILELVRTGFLGGVLLVPQGVLGELQQIADSSDPGRRNRGRRGLDVVAKLQRDPTVEVVLVEEEAMGDVDAGLVRLARDRGGVVVTADANLAKVARAVSVTVRSINDLAAGLRAPVVAGEQIRVRLTREGRDHGQAVGHLDDGTMVVVERGRPHIGEEVGVLVTNVLQTATGRMVFAVMATEGGDAVDDQQADAEEEVAKEARTAARAAAPHPAPRAGQIGRRRTE